MSKVVEECGAPQPTPIILFTNSHNAYLTATNPLNKARTRCIDIWYKWEMKQVQAQILLSFGRTACSSSAHRPLLLLHYFLFRLHIWGYLVWYFMHRTNLL